MSHVREIRPQGTEPAQENASWYDGCASVWTIYAYAGGDPINATDPSGLDDEANHNYGQNDNGPYGHAGDGTGSNRDTATTPTQSVNSNDQGVANFINNNPVVGPRFFGDYQNVSLLTTQYGGIVGAIPRNLQDVVDNTTFHNQVRDAIATFLTNSGVLADTEVGVHLGPISGRLDILAANPATYGLTTIDIKTGISPQYQMPFQTTIFNHLLLPNGGVTLDRDNQLLGLSSGSNLSPVDRVLIVRQIDASTPHHTNVYNPANPNAALRY